MRYSIKSYATHPPVFQRVYRSRCGHCLPRWRYSSNWCKLGRLLSIYHPDPFKTLMCHLAVVLWKCSTRQSCSNVGAIGLFFFLQRLMHVDEYRNHARYTDPVADTIICRDVLTLTFNCLASAGYCRCVRLTIRNRHVWSGVCDDLVILTVIIQLFKLKPGACYCIQIRVDCLSILAVPRLHCDWQWFQWLGWSFVPL